MNNLNTYTYFFSIIKDEFYNDYKEKIIKKKFESIVDNYKIEPQKARNMSLLFKK
ncbi:MAG: hypothetical protein JJE21_01110 [Spirochaetaceae bacterium]|nr:hypothetical protein [Spirochaetaceae bacterium]